MEEYATVYIRLALRSVELALADTSDATMRISLERAQAILVGLVGSEAEPAGEPED